MKLLASRLLFPVFLLFVFYVFGSTCFAQDPYILLKRGVETNQSGDYRSALAYLKQGIDLSKVNNRKKTEAMFSIAVGRIYSDFFEVDSALTFHQRALTIHREIGNVNGEGDANRDIGLIYRKFGNYSSAKQHFRTALDLYKQTLDRKAEGDTIRDVGIVYSKLAIIHEQLHPTYKPQNHITECQEHKHRRCGIYLLWDH